MVARTDNIAPRFAVPAESVWRERWRMVQFTRQDAAAMVRAGIIPEDASTELLHGTIVLKDRSSLKEDPMTVGVDHRICVEKLSKLRIVIDTHLRHVESQQPLVCSETHVPEPDFMVLRGTIDDYTDLAMAADAFCVVEVADSSYERDASDKLSGYARAGIQQYVIVNLRSRSAELYINPDIAAGMYPRPEIVQADGVLQLRVGDSELFEVSLKSLLP